MATRAHADYGKRTVTFGGDGSGLGYKDRETDRGSAFEMDDPAAVLLACRAPSRRNPERFVCGAKLGETLAEVRFMGVVRRWADRTRATDAPRDARRCPKCGWYNLYEPAG
jgi:hypothetical protein